MSFMQWRELSSSMEESLIEKVRSRPCLYDTKCPEYRDLEKRIAAWEEIGAELKINPEHAKREWEKLRRCFMNALHRRRQRKTDGAKKIPPWKYEQEMNFLLPTHRTRKPRHKYEDPDDIINDEETPEFQEQMTTNDDSSEHVNIGGGVRLEDQVNLIDDSGASSSHHHHHHHHESMAAASQTHDHHGVSVYEIPPSLDQREYRKRKRLAGDCDDLSVHDMVDCILKENSSPTRTMKTLNDSTSPLRDLDETDMFFLSLAKTTKTLSIIDQAKVKLAVSQSVLQAQISANEQQSSAPSSGITKSESR